MKVLVTGAAGFIGRHVVAALVSAGHEVSRGLRGGSAAAGPADVLCDFDLDVQPESWLPRLAGVDAVINCAGILREGRGARFESVHVAAPHALFRACEHLGIRRVIQVSALGDPADGEFIASKHRGDALLASTALDWVVLRPSVVYSTQGSYGGTSLLRAMAVTPFVLALPGDGRQRLQPIDADDLAAMIVALLAPGATSKTVIEVVGPEMLTLEDYLRQWRTWLKAPSPQVVLHVPGWLVGAVAAIGERLGSGPLGRTMNSMLARGNVGAPGSLARMQSILGRMPRTLRMALAERPSFVQDRWQARLHLLEPMLRIALVFVWIFSARVGFSTPAAEIDAMLRPVGLGPEVSIPLVRAASAIDLLLGLLLLARWRPRLVGALMIASLAGYTAFIGTMLPGAWLDPFGGLLKNVALLPAVAVMMAMGGTSMTDWYLPLKLLHILSSTLLFGTGIGTAFSMWRAHASGDTRVIASTCRSVVLADWLFTTPAVIVQPATGLAMIAILGYPPMAPWLVATYSLYVLVGACWLPVVGLQLRMKRLATLAVERDEPLPPAYHRCFALWFALGWPAFTGVVAIFALMVWKPALWN